MEMRLMNTIRKQMGEDMNEEKFPNSILSLKKTCT